MPTPKVATRLRTLDPLLVRGSGETLAGQYLDDLLTWSVGDRSWVTATRDYVNDHLFVEAASAAQHVQDDEQRDALADDLQAAWEAWLTAQRDAAGRTRARGDELLGRPLDDELRDSVDNVIERRAGLTDSLEKLADSTQPFSLTALAKASSQRINEVQRGLVGLAEELDLVDLEFEDRVAEHRKQLKQALREIDEQLYDLLLEPETTNDAEKLKQLALDAFKADDLARLQSYQRSVTALVAGEKVDFSDIQDRQEPRPKPHQPIRLTVETNIYRRPSVPYSPLTLTTLSQQRPNASPTPPSQVEHYDPSRVARRRDLNPSISDTLHYLSGLDQNDLHRERTMGVYLLEQAKLHLIDKNLLHARTIFGDAWKWVSSYTTTGDEQAMHLRAWRATCTWGFTLAFLLLHVNRGDSARILERHNIEALFTYPFGELPLAHIEQSELFEEYSRQILLLGSPAAAELSRYFVLPYLNEHPVAKQDFAAGLFRQSCEDVVTLGELIALMVTSSVYAGDTLVQDIKRIVRKHQGGSPSLQRFRSDIRTLLSQHAPESSVIEVMLDAIARLDDRVAQPDEQSHNLITSSLLTKHVVVGSDIPGRIVFSVTGNPAIEPQFGLRANVRLLDKHGNKIMPVPPPPLIDSIRSGERREVAVSIQAWPEQAQRGRRVQVQYTKADHNGTWQPVSTQHESFGLTIERATVQDLPPTPYVVGDAVSSAEFIYGRQETVTRIYDSLCGREQDNVVLVLGDRRIGKTTLLNALENDARICSRYPVIARLDLEDLDHKDITFFRRLVDRVQLALHRGGYPRHKDILDRLHIDPGYYFRSFMQRVDKSLVGRNSRMLVILDELERVYESISAAEAGKDGLPRAVIASLRATIQECQRVGFILAGVTDVLKKHIASPDERLFKLALNVELEPLAHDAARALIEEPPSDQYTVATQAADYLAANTGGHPYLLQCVCHHLFLDMTKRQARVATVTDVEDVLERKILPDVTFFSYLTEPWRANKQDHVLLRTLAHLHASQRYQFGDRYRPRRRFFSISDIQQHAARSGVMLDERDIRHRLEEMCSEMSTVLERGRRNQFRLKIGLLARHLQWIDRSSQDLILRS